MDEFGDDDAALGETEPMVVAALDQTCARDVDERVSRRRIGLVLKMPLR